jgi:hypothetical protein
MLGLASLVEISKARRGWGADRMLAVSGAAAAGWFFVEGRRRQ